MRMRRGRVRMHRDLAIHIRYCTCIARSYAPLPPSASPSPVMSSASFRAPAGNTDPNVEQCPYCRKPYKKRGYHQHVEACKRKHMQALEDLQLQEQLEDAQAQGRTSIKLYLLEHSENNGLTAQAEDFERLQLSLGMTSQSGKLVRMVSIAMMFKMLTIWCHSIICIRNEKQGLSWSWWAWRSFFKSLKVMILRLRIWHIRPRVHYWPNVWEWVWRHDTQWWATHPQ